MAQPAIPTRSNSTQGSLNRPYPIGRRTPGVPKDRETLKRINSLSSRGSAPSEGGTLDRGDRDILLGRRRS